MAWIDDRIWCHPKLSDLSSPAFRAYINGIAYSAGMGTRGHLSPAQQRQIGGNSRARDELVTAGLWDMNGDGKSVLIHDWDEHNGKRDKRREQDRLRKREARMSAGTSAGQSTGRSAGASTGPSRGASAGTARVEGSEGSEGKTPNPDPVVRGAEIDFPIPDLLKTVEP